LLSIVTRHVSFVDAKATPLPRGAIRRAAASLGVTREHLSRVLHGKRASRSLLTRFRQWLSSST